MNRLQDTGEKIVIVIDEFPYIAKRDKSIPPSILQSIRDSNLGIKNN